MPERKLEKYLGQMADLFEKSIENGTYLDGEKITFANFVDKWMSDYAEVQLAPKTLHRHKEMLYTRIIPALGQIKIAKIQPTHLTAFYRNIAELGMRSNIKSEAQLPKISARIRKRFILLPA